MENKIIRRTKGKFLATFAVLLTVFLLPFLSVTVITFGASAVYDDTFVGELGEKYELLNSVEGEKLVVIGGSSVAFGLESSALEREIDMPVVNFGLYANLGTKLMLDLSRSGIGDGDVVVVAPEMNDQTLSLYFNSETTMQALDGNFKMISSIDKENYEALIGASWGFAADKLGYILRGDVPENAGAYSKKWFNSYGDNVYDRPYNEMSTVTKNITLDFKYDENDGVTSEYEEFVDYLNEYVEFCTGKGATVYFSFPPMNKASFTDYNTEENIYAFYDNLCSSLHCKVISNINDYIMDEGYFFDSEFHLNNAGVKVRTAHLADDLKREMGITDKTTIELPNPPGYKPVDFVGGSETNLYLKLEEGKNGAGQSVWYVVGLNEEGMKQVSITLPNNVDGIPVYGIRAGAFQGSELRTLVICDNVSVIESSAFAGAESLTAVYVPTSTPDSIAVPNTFSGDLITEGANSALKIYVPKGSLFDYVSHYFWGDYGEWLSEYEPKK